MKMHKTEDESGGKYIVFTNPDIEYVNPVQRYTDIYMETSYRMEEELMKQAGYPMSPTLDKVLKESALKDWNEKYETINSAKIPKGLLNILNSQTKKEQIRHLKALEMTPTQLTAFFFYAYEKHGYLFSQYKAEHYHKGLKEDDLPKLINLKEDEVVTIGETPLSKGQQKQVVLSRKVVVSKFIDKENEWHCLFVTFESLKGNENWQDGQPHYHYISDKFGIPRDEVLKQLKSKKYKLGSLPHINLLDYGHQPKKEK